MYALYLRQTIHPLSVTDIIKLHSRQTGTSFSETRRTFQSNGPSHTPLDSPHDALSPHDGASAVEEQSFLPACGVALQPETSHPQCTVGMKPSYFDEAQCG
jgi:hypothetical protein